MKHVFIVNPKSFPEQKRMDTVIDSIGTFFTTQESQNFSIQVINYPRDAIGLIQEQVDKAEEGETVRVYAVGGDEILFDCLNGIVGLPNMELAVVPYGATNDFVRVFGEGKAELFRDIHALVDASSIPTDIIDTGNNFAINVCSVGLVSEVILKMRRADKRPGGLRRLTLWDQIKTFFYYVASVFGGGVLSQHYEVTVDDLHFSGNFGFINVANGPFFGGNRIAVKKAMPNDGLLDVAIFKSTNPLRFLISIGIYAMGRMPSNLFLLQAKKISLQSDDPILIQLDGDFFQDTNITFEVVPGAVQVVSVNNLPYQAADYKAVQEAEAQAEAEAAQEES